MRKHKHLNFGTIVDYYDLKTLTKFPHKKKLAKACQMSKQKDV